jgi:hypothetical protein
MKRARSRIHRRGYLIIEMLFWIGLLGVFAFTAGHLFVRTFRVIHDSQVQIDCATRFDAAVQRLREDVAAATSTETQGDQMLLVHQPAGDVQWRSDGKQSIARTASDGERSWDVGQRIAFAMDGQIALVRADPSNIASDIAIATAPEMR